MNKYYTPITSRLLMGSLAVMASPFVFGQVEKAEEGEVFELSPFTVDGSTDEGYYASETLAGGRLKTSILDTGSSIEVLTKDFLNDIGATDVQEMLQYTTSGEVGGINGNIVGGDLNSSSGNLSTLNARHNPSSTTRIRGLGSPDRTRSFYKTAIPLDAYNVDRIDINRGSNSFLFGLGSPAGLINSNLSRANFSNRTNVNFSVGSGGDKPSIRSSADINRVILEDKLAIRVALLSDNEKYVQNPTYKDDERVYTAVTFRPFGNGSTTIRAHFEDGKIEGNPPDTMLPAHALDSFIKYRKPVDTWFNARYFGETEGYNPEGSLKASATEYWNSLTDAERAQFWQAGDAGYEMLASPGFSGIDLVWDGTKGVDPSFWLQANIGPYYVDDNPFFDAFPGVEGPGVTGTGFQAYQNSRNEPDRGNGYYNTTYQNLEAFNFVKQTIAGNSDYIRTDLRNYNIAIEQLFWGGNAGFEIGFDKQETDRFGYTNFNGWSGQIQIDVNRTLLQPLLDENGSIIRDSNGNIVNQARLNPNFGRPFTKNKSSASGEIDDREAARFTAFLKHDFAERNDGWLKWLGKHTLTGMGDRYEREYRGSKSQLSTFSDDIDLWWSFSNDSNGKDPGNNLRHLNSIIYMGPALQSYINDPFNPNTPLSVNDIRIDPNPFNLLAPDPVTMDAIYWNRGADADARVPNEKGQNQPGNHLNNGDENWSSGSVTTKWIPSDNNTAGRSFVESWAVSLQSKFLKNHLVINAGYREDNVKQWENGSTPVDANGIPTIDPSVFSWEDGAFFEIRKGSGNKGSFGYGGVLHMPKELLRFPNWLDATLHYNFSKNFDPSAARTTFDENTEWAIIPPPEGEGKDFGVTFRMMENKLVARLNWYENSIIGKSSSRGAFRGLLWGSFWAYGNAQKALNKYDVNGDGQLDEDWDPVRYNAFDQVQGVIDQYHDLLYSGYMQAAIEETGFKLNEDGTFNKGPWFQHVQDTENVTSKGFEGRITFNPTNSWRINFNAANVEAVKSDLQPAATRYLDAYLPIYFATAGLNFWDPAKNPDPAYSKWGDLVGNNNRVGRNFRDYFREKLQEGQASIETRDWRFNFTTNYSFRQGMFKGFQFGGSARWQSSGIIGYGRTDYAPDPNAPDQTIVIDDLNNTYESEEEINIDLKFGYRTKLRNGKIQWSSNLYIKNVNNFDSDELSVFRTNPDGSAAAIRFNPPLTWEWSNSISF